MDLERWHLWKRETKPGKAKPSKVPYKPNERKSSPTNSADWVSYERARNALKDGWAEGIGFSTGQGIGAVDIDDCFDNDKRLADWAKAIIDRTETYVEKSPINGLRIIGLTTGKRVNSEFVYKTGKLGLFRGEDCGHNFSVTGFQYRPCDKLGSIDNLIDYLVTLERRPDRTPPFGIAYRDRRRKTDRQPRSDGKDDSPSNQFNKKVWRLIGRGWTDDKIEADILGNPEKWAETAASRFIIGKRLRRVGKEGEPGFKFGEIERVRAKREARDDETITEDGAALAFVDEHVDDLRFDHDAGAWFEWNSSFWKRDGTRVAFSWARELARGFAKDQSGRLKYLTSKMSFAAAVERGAQSDQRVAVTQDAWDGDHYLLGTPKGTVDLHTGKLREPNPDDMITKMTAAAPARMKTPVWDQFLCEVTGDDDDLIRFLQTVLGYALTGDTSEDLLVFVHGPGGNGKTTFLNTVAGICGDYATAAAMDTFTQTRTDRHPADMAMLRGARLVTCAETTEGRAWDETRVKQFTGGDPITARFMRQNFFTYMPQFQISQTPCGAVSPWCHSCSSRKSRTSNWKTSSRTNGREFWSGWLSAVYAGNVRKALSGPTWCGN
jgi:putative DNA primase/helicase